MSLLVELVGDVFDRVKLVKMTLTFETRSFVERQKSSKCYKKVIYKTFGLTAVTFVTIEIGAMKTHYFAPLFVNEICKKR